MNAQSLLKYLLAFFATYSFLQHVDAKTSFSESRCKNNDCSHYGSISLLETGANEIRCKKNDCGKFGWYAFFNGELYSEATCKKESCYNVGWTIRPIFYQATRLDAICKNGDCFKYGWVSRGIGQRSLVKNVTCKQDDCKKFGMYSIARRRGVIFPSKTISSAVCVDLDCRHKGWVATHKPFWDNSNRIETLQ